MQFEDLSPVDRADAAVELSSGDPERVSLALLRLALHEPDWRYVQDLCLVYVDDPAVWVRRNCATALGHLARLHQELDLERALPVLRRLQGDPDVASWAESAVDDITAFIPEGVWRAQGM